MNTNATANIKLSPGNLIGLRRTALPPKSLEHETKEVREVVAYQCPTCCELHEWESDAEECCKKNSAPPDVFCPVCNNDHETHRDAADCCLWIDLDAITRWKIADAVEAGSEWSVELGLVPA